MPPMPEEKIAAIAKERVEGVMADLFENPVRCVLRDGAETRWRPVMQRHVYESVTDVYHKINAVQVAVHRDGRVIGFRDETRFEVKDDPPFAPLPKGELDAICRTTGVLAGDAAIVEVGDEEGGILEMNYQQSGRGAEERVKMIVNVCSMQVAAFSTDDAAAGLV